MAFRVAVLSAGLRGVPVLQGSGALSAGRPVSRIVTSRRTYLPHRKVQASAGAERRSSRTRSRCGVLARERVHECVQRPREPHAHSREDTQDGARAGEVPQRLARQGVVRQRALLLFDGDACRREVRGRADRRTRRQADRPLREGRRRPCGGRTLRPHPLRLAP